MRTVKRDIVSALVYSEDNKLLMGKKDPKAGGVYPDCWHIPGGGIEAGETKEEAVKREVLEEVGIDISPYSIELISDNDTGTAKKTLKNTGEEVLVDMHFFVYKVTLAGIMSDSIELKLNDDLTEARWFSIPELSTVNLTPPSEKYFRKIKSIK